MRAREWLVGSPSRGVSPEALKYGRTGEESQDQRVAEAGLGRKWSPEEGEHTGSIWEDKCNLRHQRRHRVPKRSGRRDSSVAFWRWWQKRET